MADTKMSEKLWRDCKSDQERADFILCGRAHETGVIATSIQSEVAMAFQRLATLQSLTSINFTLPNHEPTIAIGEILDGYDGDDRDDVWESIKAYADVHARAALEATPPADAALADALDGMCLGDVMFEDKKTLRKAAAALRARAVPAGWINPNDKTQQRFLPDIGEKVLFCHAGRTFYGKHTGGSFMSLVAPSIGQTFNTWECRWMYPPAAILSADTEVNK